VRVKETPSFFSAGEVQECPSRKRVDAARPEKHWVLRRGRKEQVRAARGDLTSPIIDWEVAGVGRRESYLQSIER